MTTSRLVRIGLCATPEQAVMLRRAAKVAHKTLTDFVLDAACQAAENTLLDQCLFVVPEEKFTALEQQLDVPAKHSAGLTALFAKPPVWKS